MSFTTGYVDFFIFFTVAHRLAPLSPDPAINFSNPAFDAFKRSRDPQYAQRNSSCTIHYSPTLPTTLVLRDGRIYGSGLNKESRLNAWKSIPTDSESITYGSRMKG